MPIFPLALAPCCSLSMSVMLICAPASGSRPCRGNLPMFALPSCCYGLMPCLSPLLGAATSHGIAPMTPHLYAQGIVPLCHATSLHKAFPPHATVGKGRLHSTPSRCNHELHTITCHGAHVWLLARRCPCALLMSEDLH